MKRLPVIISLTFFAILTAVVGRAAWIAVCWREDYGEAEPLVEIIWPLAHSMKEYEKEFGRSPTTLQEVKAFNPRLELSALSPYDLTFQPEGKQRFFVRVNRRFAFEIDDRFEPSWAEFTAVFASPK